MQAWDPLNLLRRLINDPNTGGPRFTDATLLSFLDEAQVQAVRDTSSPESYQVFSTVQNQQEYQVYEQLETKAVYCAGKLLAPSSIDILEGWNTHQYSQNPQGAPPVSGSGAVPGTLGPGNPAWTNAPPEVYPSNTGFESAIKPTVQPYSNMYGAQFLAQPERYYWRNPGYIGLVPQPANATPVQVVIYGVCLPPEIVTTDTTLLVPQSYRMLIVRYAEWLCRSSENTTNPGQQILIENAFNAYNRELAKIRMKVRNAQGKIPRTFKHIPSRLGKSRYHVRRNGGC